MWIFFMLSMIIGMYKYCSKVKYGAMETLCVDRLYIIFCDLPMNL